MKKSSLIKECIKRGIPHADYDGLTADEMVGKIQEFELHMLPPSERKVYNLFLEHFRPMLAARSAPPEYITESGVLDWARLERECWIAERKANGVRMVIVLAGGICDKDVAIFSRNVSRTNFLPINYAGHFKVFCNRLSRSSVNTCPVAMDTEFIVAGHDGKTDLAATTSIINSTPRHAQEALNAVRYRFEAFDLISFVNPVVEHSRRFRNLTSCLNALHDTDDWFGDAHHRIELIEKPRQGETARDFYQRIVSTGGEGIIMKRDDATYIPGDRPRDRIFKVKRSVRGNRAVSDKVVPNVTAFIMGATPGKKGSAFDGLIGSVQFGIDIKGENVAVANVSGIPLPIRKAMSHSNGELRGRYIGRVFPINGMSVSHKRFRLTHAVADWESFPEGVPYNVTLNNKQLRANVL